MNDIVFILGFGLLSFGYIMFGIRKTHDRGGIGDESKQKE